MIRVMFACLEDDCVSDLERSYDLPMLPPVGDMYEGPDGQLYGILRRVWTPGPDAEADVICELRVAEA